MKQYNFSSFNYKRGKVSNGQTVQRAAGLEFFFPNNIKYQKI